MALKPIEPTTKVNALSQKELGLNFYNFKSVSKQSSAYKEIFEYPIDYFISDEDKKYQMKKQILEKIQKYRETPSLTKPATHISGKYGPTLQFNQVCNTNTVYQPYYIRTDSNGVVGSSTTPKDRVQITYSMSNWGNTPFLAPDKKGNWVQWRTAEGYFHYLRFPSADRRLFQNASGKTAQSLRREVKDVIKETDEEKMNNMRRARKKPRLSSPLFLILLLNWLVWYKFSQHEISRKRLLAVGDTYILYYGNDDYWVDLTGDLERGSNILGYLMMELRLFLLPDMKDVEMTGDRYIPFPGDFPYHRINYNPFTIEKMRFGINTLRGQEFIKKTRISFDPQWNAVGAWGPRRDFSTVCDMNRPIAFYEKDEPYYAFTNLDHTPFLAPDRNGTIRSWACSENYFHSMRYDLSDKEYDVFTQSDLYGKFAYDAGQVPKDQQFTINNVKNFDSTESKLLYMFIARTCFFFVRYCFHLAFFYSLV
jgi:predicted NAD-dependent protein-ADP-ribosyltransferase YbiA (DUF1768 family)